MGEIAVPGAYGRTLRNRPLQRCLPAGTAGNAPNILSPPFQAHGFQFRVLPPAGKAGLDQGIIKLIHNHNSSRKSDEPQQEPVGLSPDAMPQQDKAAFTVRQGSARLERPSSFELYSFEIS